MKKVDNQQFELLKFYRLQEDKTHLAKEVQKMAKRLNQRYRVLEKNNLQSNSYAYQISQSETGRDVPRYSESLNKLEKLDINNLFELGLQLNVKLWSKTSLPKGVEEVKVERIDKAVESLSNSLGKKVDKDIFKSFLEKGGGKLLNYRYLDSEQVVDDLVAYMEEGNVTIKEFVNEFNRFRKRMSEKKKLDYGRITRNLNNLVARKKKKAKRKKK